MKLADMISMDDRAWRDFMDTVRTAQSLRSAEKRAEFQYGDRVAFVARGMRQRRPLQFTSTVLRLNFVTAPRWRVSPSLLQKATEKVPA